ncbi:hypothetical protein B0A52_08295 [Exophiala mesophila]|uniref:Uncharacterized protein n=1 Tax=Exophiala mesophila TaxID=212818 RepID=A0A438MVY2_EXOME|nr:hypothetical protein B0A52_08295 [Exophiala mesophila]
MPRHPDPFYNHQRPNHLTKTLRPWTETAPSGQPPSEAPGRTELGLGYSRSSGQIFVDYEVRLSRNKNSDWIRDYRTPSLAKRAHLANVGTGARSLASIAQSRVAAQMRNLTPDHFYMIPWAMAEEIWHDILDRRTESFHAWRTLASAFPHADEFGQREYRYLLDIRQPQLAVSDYFSSITSSDLKWLTCLRISPKQLAKSDLVAIHQIRNLAVLDLSDGQVTIGANVSCFDERVMRTWAELAATKQAFQHLRVMLFGWQEDLSDWIFRYVNHFPSLCYIIVTDCPGMHQRNRPEWEPSSKSRGWEAKHAKPSAKSLRPIVGEKEFGPGAISGCYYESMGLYESLVNPRRPDLTESVPILETWIGSPRPWTHIVEDFPSTRTIFFENIKTKSWEEKQAKAKAKSTGDDQVKRSRNSGTYSHESASPPPKRPGSQARPLRKPVGKTMADILAEFH